MTAVTDKIRNGVDTEQLFSTLDLIKDQPELARFQFRATNRWIDGSHNRSTIKGFYAAGGEDTTRSEEFVIDAGEPGILVGTDAGANPAITTIECEIVAEHPTGDHWIVVAQVDNLHISATNDPLIFFAGAYRAVR